MLIKETTLLQRHLRAQQFKITKHKIQDPVTNKIAYEPEEIHIVLKDCYGT